MSLTRPVVRPLTHPLSRPLSAPGAGGKAIPDPLTLSPLIFHDFTDFSTLWQDTAKTVPAGIGDPVRVVANKGTLGSAGDLVAPSDSERPVLGVDDLGFVQFKVDGSNDRASTTAALTLKPDIAIAYCIGYPQTTVTQNRGFAVWAYNTSNFFAVGARSDFNEQANVNVRADSTSGTNKLTTFGVDSHPAGLTPSVVIGGLTAAAISFQRNGGTKQTDTLSATYGPVSNAYFGIGYQGSGAPIASPTPLNCYGGFIGLDRDLNDSERALIYEWFKLHSPIYEAAFGACLGDSNVGNYSGATPVTTTIPQHVIGFTCRCIATSGDQIANQKTKWEAITDYSRFRVVFVQVGLNDLKNRVGEGLATSSQVIAALQDLIDTVREDVPAACKIVVCALTPCREWLENATNGAAAYAAWQAMNEAIMGGGATPITGVDARINGYDADLNDGSGYLVDAYNIGGAGGDGVHLTDGGRALVGGYWRTQLVADGLVPS